MSATEARKVSEASTIITPMNNNSTRKANRTWRNRVKGYTQSINHKNKQLINAFAKGRADREKYLQKIAEYPQADDPPPTEDEIVALNFFTS